MWDPDSGSDVSIKNRSQYNSIQRHFYNSSTAITLTKGHSHFTTANSSRMKFDGFFTARRIWTLGLITYHPEGKQVNVRKVEENSKTTDKGISIELKNKDWIKKFETLHKKHEKVFSGMGLLKDYEVELKLAEDTPEFFYRPSLVPVHLQDRATERLNEYIKLGLFELVPQGTPIKYLSSLLVIEEKDKVRLVGDYHYVNEFIRPTSTTVSPRLDTFFW